MNDKTVGPQFTFFGSRHSISFTDPVGLLLGVVTSPIWVSVGLISFLQQVCFRLRWNGRIMFVCSGRHGWHDFLMNNVIPVLPKGIVVVWDHHAWKDKVLSRIRYEAYDRQRPYLTLVKLTNLSIVDLHEPLLPLKSDIGRHPKTQELVRSIIGGAVRHLQEAGRGISAS